MESVSIFMVTRAMVGRSLPDTAPSRAEVVHPPDLACSAFSKCFFLRLCNASALRPRLRQSSVGPSMASVDFFFPWQSAALPVLKGVDVGVNCFRVTQSYSTTRSVPCHWLKLSGSPCNEPSRWVIGQHV